jgi:hypothetical protein
VHIALNKLGSEIVELIEATIPTMKKLLLVALAFSLPFTLAVRADDNPDTNKKKRKPAPPTATAQAQTVQQIHRTPTTAASARTAASAQWAQQHSARPMTVSQSLSRNRNVDRGNTSLNVQNRTATRNANVAAWNSRTHQTFNRNSFTIARSQVIRTFHDRDWWRDHFHTRFVLFGGGYYYWNSGYWYPAYGYSPIYNTYAYDEPIYGYNNLAPGQVLENVQLALRDQGYYRGEIDGLVGPQTRAALAAYQRDSGLVVTAAVDEPTLVTLGLA